jgi:hypothetical protein
MVTTIFAAILVCVTFGWIAIDAIRSHRRERMLQVNLQIDREIATQRLRRCPVTVIERKVQDNLTTLAQMVPGEVGSWHREHTPPAMQAVDVSMDETRMIQTIRQQTDEVEKLARKTLGA